MGAGINAALLAFHQDAGQLDLAKNRSAHKNEYLDLDKAMGQVRPALARHGMYAVHVTGRVEADWWVATKIVHAESGEEITSGPFPLAPTSRDAQGWGGALTYGRRYTLMAVLGLVADNDDDGNGPQRRQRQTRQTGKITALQRNALMAAARAAKVPTDRLKEIVQRVAGVESSADIPAEKYDELLKAVKAEA